MSTWDDYKTRGYAGPCGLLQTYDLSEIRRKLGLGQRVSVEESRGLLAHLDKLQHSLDQLEARVTEPDEDFFEPTRVGANFPDE